MKSIILVGLLVLLSVFVAACSAQEQMELPQPDASEDTVELDIEPDVDVMDVDDTVDDTPVSVWLSMPLTDVVTGDTFVIGENPQSPVLLQSFAVWCPNCKRQQDHIQDLLQTYDAEIRVVSLATDPNEGTDTVRNHVQQHGFEGWHFAVSPTAYTQALVDEFGTAILSAPREPMVLVCTDGSTRFLRSGSKPASVLMEEIQTGC